MVVLYIVARSFLHMHEAWNWVRAFAEAGMIGALADWFAVVALFRHPLGIPIPHTAIVKNKKEKISAKIAHGLKEQIIATSKNADHQSFYNKLSLNLCNKLATQPLEKGIGNWIGGVMHGEEFRSVLAPLLGKLAQGVGEQREWVENNASERAPERKSKILTKLTKGFSRAVSGHMVDQVSNQLQEASENPEHLLYDKIEASLQELSTELQSEEENQEWATWRKEILNSTRTHKTIADIFSQAGDLITEEQDKITTTLENGLAKFAQEIVNSPEETTRWENELSRVIDNFADKYADAVEKLIIDRVNAWDADSLADNMERSVGNDLQYIRINGTLIGGLIGLVLHGVGLLIWGH